MRYQLVENTMLRDPRGEMILCAFLLDVRCRVRALAVMINTAISEAPPIWLASPFERWALLCVKTATDDDIRFGCLAYGVRVPFGCIRSKGEEAWE